MKRLKTIKALALEICRREGLKRQVDIAQVSEILGHLSDIFYEFERLDYRWTDPDADLIFKHHNPPNDPCDLLIANGAKRAKKREKKIEKKK